MTNWFRRLGRAVFGEFDWQAPPWLARLGAWRRAGPLRFWTTVAALPVALLLGYVVVQWLPEPVLTRVAVEPPGITVIGADGKLYPRPVVVTFATAYPDARDEGPRDAARLDLVGKELTEHIALSPPMPGTWRWQDARTLRFEPGDDWPAGERYRLRLEPELFADGVALEDWRPAFTTPSIRASLDKLEFYQNPQTPTEHRVVATLAFTHAVDEASLRRHLDLAMRPSDESVDVAPAPYDYDIELDEHARHAYITTRPIDLPPRENFMTLTLTAGVAAASGPSTTAEPLQDDVTVPSVDTYFRVSGMAARIVRNEDGDPEQTLVVDFTSGVSTGDVAARIEAWLLPPDRRWRPDDLDQALLARSDRIDLEPNPTEHADAALQSFRFDVPERRQLYVRLPPGLTSQGVYEMTVPYGALLRAPDYPREAGVVGDGALLALTGQRQLSLRARGVPALKVEVFRLRDDQLVHLVTQTRGDLSQARFANRYVFNEANLAERTRRVLPLNAESPADAVYASLDLDGFLRAGGYGVFVLRVDGWDPQRERTIPGASDRRLVLVTDLSLIAKDQADRSHALFLHSLGRQGPVAGAVIELLGVNGRPVVTRRTDQRGYAAMPDVSDLHDEQQPAVYLVRHQGDVSFLPFGRRDRQLELSGFDTGGVREASLRDDRALRAAVFTDRGIYRPGETGHLGVMVKRRDWAGVAGVPVDVVMTNPRGNVVLSERQALPADGFFEVPLSFRTADPTGAYHARVYLVDEARNVRMRQIGDVGLSVEEFQPDTMRIRTRIDGGEHPGWRTLEQYRGDVHLENLFGLPAQGRRVEASYTLRPTRFRFDDYAGYVFEDPFRDAAGRLERSVTESLPGQTSDASGDASFPIDLSAYGGGLYHLTFSAEGYEPDGGRSVAARSAALVSPAERLVGWRADGDLSYLRADADRQVHFVAVEPDLESVSATDLTLRVVEKQPVSTLVRQNDGTLAYQTVVRREVVWEVPFAIDAGGSVWPVPTDAAGDFVAEVSGAGGRVMARVDYTVAGERNVSGGTQTEGRLALKLDKHSYRAGEDIEMQITAPYTGAGLVTIERDRVYAHRWFTADGHATVEHIRVPDDLEGNAYVNVTFVRSLDAEEIFTRPLSYAVAPFDVDRERRTVDIGLNVPERVKPGERLDIGVTTSQPARLAVFAVDEGILQVAGYATPDPLDVFLQKRALEVTTSQMADLLLPEFRLLESRMAPGGGQMARALALGANLNPFQRNVRAPVVYWSDIVETTGEPLTLSFDVPDYFDGRLRIMAVASAAGAAGSADTETVVRGPFVLAPNVITTAAPGDRFEVSVGVTNALEEDGAREITVTVEPDAHLEVTGDTARTLSLEGGREGRVRFALRATDQIGAAELVFRARAGEHELTRTSTLSVRPAVAQRTTLNAGVGEAGEGRTVLPRRLRPALAEQQATLGYSPLILAGGLKTYLDGFPHLCSEQLVSRVFPAVALMNDPAMGIDPQATMDDYRDVVSSLQARQLGDGAFGFWPGTGQGDDFVTIYVVHFLTDAQELGVPVPGDMLATGLDRLRIIAGGDVKPGRGAFLQAYAAYVLTRNQRVTTNYLTRLQDTLDRGRNDAWRGTLTAAYLAASYRLLKLDDLANELIDGYRYAEPGSDYESDLDSALARNAQYVYLLARHFPARLAGVDTERVRRIVTPITEGRYNTLSSAYTMLALGAWGRTAGDGAGGVLTIGAEDAGGTAQPLASGEPPVLRADVPLSARAVTFAGDSGGRLFHTVTQSGYDRALPDTAVTQGMEVVREFVDEDGRVVNAARQGSELTVRLRVRSLDNRHHPNVALVDLLPGGFEVLRDSVRRQSGGWSTDYVDIREDRLVVYTTVTSGARTFSYRVKVTGAGEFVVPPAFAESMYHPDLQARSLPGRFTVERP